MSYEAMEARDTISKGPVKEDELSSIVERLYSSHTVSSGGEAGKNAPTATNVVSRPPASESEKKEIYNRLAAAHTKSSNGSQCKPADPAKTPGLGLKMLPVIEGIETRFRDAAGPPEKVQEVIGRLNTTQTAASKARNDNPRILLYPERTTLMNNVERILAYQQSGSVARQNMLQRREKWFN